MKLLIQITFIFFYLSTFLLASENITSLLNSAKTLSRDDYFHFVMHIKNGDVLNIIKKPYATEQGLIIKYLDYNNEFLDENAEKYLFHGTKATMEIISNGGLKAYKFTNRAWDFFWQKLLHIGEVYYIQIKHYPPNLV